MGTRFCNRHNCTNILCDRYSSKYGYICEDCFNELVSLGHTADISEFMASSAGVDREKMLEKARAVFELEFLLNES